MPLNRYGCTRSHKIQPGQPPSLFTMELPGIAAHFPWLVVTYSCLQNKPKTTPKAEQSPLREYAGYHGGFPWWLSGKESTCQCKRHRFNPWVGKIPWRRKWLPTPVFLASPVAQLVKNPPTMQETWVQSLGREDPLEEDMATSSSILAWRIPWTGEPGGLQSMGL